MLALQVLFGFHLAYARQVTVCSAGDVMEYAWTTNALDFDDVQVKRMIVPFSTISGMLHLMEYGYCDIMHTGMTVPLMAMDKGFNVSIQGVRQKIGDVLQLVAHTSLKAPSDLLGRTVVVSSFELLVAMKKLCSMMALNCKLDLELSQQTQTGADTSIRVLVLSEIEAIGLYNAGVADAIFTYRPFLPWLTALRPWRVLASASDLKRWGFTMSTVFFTTREFADNMQNQRLLERIHAYVATYDYHNYNVEVDPQSPDAAWFVDYILSTPPGHPMYESSLAEYKQLRMELASDVGIVQGDTWWQSRSISENKEDLLEEVTAGMQTLYQLNKILHLPSQQELENVLDPRSTNNLGQAIFDMQQEFNWTQVEAPGVPNPPLPYGSWMNPSTGHCDGTVVLARSGGDFTDGHEPMGSHDKSANCTWILDVNGPVLLSFPFLRLDLANQGAEVEEAILVYDESVVPARLLSRIRQAPAPTIRANGPISVQFRGRLQPIQPFFPLETGFNATYSVTRCSREISEGRSCGEGTCNTATGLCECPDGHSGAFCEMPHCMGTNVYHLSRGSLVSVQSNAAPTYAPFASCRWEMHMPVDCPSCWFKVKMEVDTESQVDTVRVLASNKRDFSWEEGLESGSTLHGSIISGQRSLQTRGTHGQSLFIWLEADGFVQYKGLVASVEVVQGGSELLCAAPRSGPNSPPCSGHGQCVDGSTSNETAVCSCDTGYFGMFCEKTVCDASTGYWMHGVAWTLAPREGFPVIESQSRCSWVLRPPALSLSADVEYAPIEVRLTFEELQLNLGDRIRILSGDSGNEIFSSVYRVTTCLSGEACAFPHGNCERPSESNWIGQCVCGPDYRGGDCRIPAVTSVPLGSSIEMSTTHSKNSYVVMHARAVFAAGDGCVAVANLTTINQEGAAGDADAALLETMICECQTSTVMIFNTTLLKCVPEVEQVLGVASSSKGRSAILELAITIPIVGLSVALSTCLFMRNKALSKHIDSMHQDMQTSIDLDSPFTKVVQFLEELSEMSTTKDPLRDRARTLKYSLLSSKDITLPDLTTLLNHYPPNMVKFLMGNTSDHMEERTVRFSNGGNARHRASTDDARLLRSTVSLLNVHEDRVGRDFFVDFTRLSDYTGVLVTTAMQLLKNWDLLITLDIPEEKMHSYLCAIENGYLDNPYHGVAHAADVTCRLGAILKTSDIANSLLSDDHGQVQLLAAVLSAAVHDFEHPGITNAFAVRMGLEPAKNHNDQAVFENHSLYHALHIAEDPDCNFKSNMMPSKQRALRTAIIQNVLATDMSRHFEILTRAKTMRPLVNMDEGFANLDNGQQDLMLQLALKVADLGHCATPPQQHYRWVERLQKEFFAQGDKERQNGIPVSPLMDREKPGPLNGKNQLGFFEVIVLPQLQLWTDMFPSSNPLLMQALANKQYWEDVPDDDHSMPPQPSDLKLPEVPEEYVCSAQESSRRLSTESFEHFSSRGHDDTGNVQFCTVDVTDNAASPRANSNRAHSSCSDQAREAH